MGRAGGWRVAIDGGLSTDLWSIFRPTHAATLLTPLVRRRSGVQLLHLIGVAGHVFDVAARALLGKDRTPVWIHQAQDPALDLLAAIGHVAVMRDIGAGHCGGSHRVIDMAAGADRD